MKKDLIGSALLEMSGDTFHHAFLWQMGVMTDLGTLAGLPISQADGINNHGQVVGFSQDVNDPNDTTVVAWLWQDGVMTDLNSLIPAGSPLFLMEAVAINDRGQIAGLGRLSNGEHRAVILTHATGSARTLKSAGILREEAAARSASIFIFVLLSSQGISHSASEWLDP